MNTLLLLFITIVYEYIITVVYEYTCMSSLKFYNADC